MFIHEVAMQADVNFELCWCYIWIACKACLQIKVQDNKFTKHEPVLTFASCHLTSPILSYLKIFIFPYELTSMAPT